MQLIGQSLPFQKVLKFIKQACQYESPVIIEGETGTGKEMIARAIHYFGSKNKGPFIPINCGAIPDALFENELYGHKRGAYTDASQDQSGLVEQADNGTLFLDEIETLSNKGQVVLLRFLQDMTYKPLGAKHHRTLNIRILAASNQSLESLVKNGQFRQDLFFRLNILSIIIPPLRERLDDVELLAYHFLEKYMGLYRQPRKSICMNTIRWMWRYDWPGNVRELENVIHRGFMLSKGDVLIVEEARTTNEDIKDEPIGALPMTDINSTLAQAKKTLIDQFEYTYLQHLLRKTGGNVSKAALIAGKERRALGKLLKKHNIERSMYMRSNSY
ncbi:MAG: sigma-54 dependent transcriptional regulator [Gammaproteobacteria bacterium]|nr:sigma-54 dependent transcriptional regulator [Gammaproteobacteria bacterium]